MAHIAAVATTYNEAEIIGLTVDHLRAEGIEAIYVADASDDGTFELLLERGCTVTKDDKGYHDQPHWTGLLADVARQHGADWVIPFDADEFWYATDGRTIVETLADVPASVGKLYARMWEHNDWDHRQPAQKPLPKVAFRPAEGMTFAPGNHDVDRVPGEVRWGVLDLREIQFHSFEHMVRKSTDRVVRIDPAFGQSYGTHQRELYVMSMDEKRAWWEARNSREVCLDPIPTRLGDHPHDWGA